MSAENKHNHDQELNKPHLSIDVTDLPPVSRPVYDQVLELFKGQPWTKEGVYEVPDIPHIHYAYVESVDEQGVASRSPSPVSMLVAHGYRRQDGEWVFRDGRPITQFIDHYNRNNVSEPIQLAAVCNPTSQSHDATQHAVASELQVSGYVDGTDTVVAVKLANPETGYMHVPSLDISGRGK